jgi:hypothetical protein
VIIKFAAITPLCLFESRRKRRHYEMDNVEYYAAIEDTANMKTAGYGAWFQVIRRLDCLAGER